MEKNREVICRYPDETNKSFRYCFLLDATNIISIERNNKEVNFVFSEKTKKVKIFDNDSENYFETYNIKYFPELEEYRDCQINKILK